MTKDEYKSREKGRRAVQASKEIPALTEKVKSLISEGKDKEKSTLFKSTEYQITINALENALFATGKTAAEVDQYMTEITGKPFRSMFAKHSIDDWDAFYEAVDDYKHRDFIEHHGTLGMKWGIRRYQNPDGSLTALGKKRLEDGSGRTEKAIAKFQQKKNTTIAKGDKKFAEKHIDYFTNEDIDRLNQRIGKRNSILEMKKLKEGINADRFKKWVDTASAIVNTAANMGDSGVRLYNTVAKINNSFTKGKKWPLVKDGGDQQNEWMKVVTVSKEGDKTITETRNVKVK